MAPPKTIFQSQLKAVQAFFWIIRLAQIGASIYFCWLFAHHGHDNYPNCKPIATWLLVSGVVVMVALVVPILFGICVGCTAAKNAESGAALAVKGGACLSACFLPLLGSFGFAWFIVGNVWVFRSKEADCQPLVYHTGFWYLIAVYIFMGVSIIASCCLCACVAFGMIAADDDDERV
eukprot:TRINITY_DN6894_c0_g1_i1.p1 TRINITY_DN6894_c0_g1~~TRINITY_DN6894_c0_g1_i1.p1  ORF type:complete len:177 (+),score=35.45 TRINITY_DN6894_c0_g1_i1:48-578(+)